MPDLILFFDTETTGLPSKKKPINDPSQPWPVQIAAILCNEDGQEISEFNALIKTFTEIAGTRVEWDIPQIVVDIHGISKQRADAEGQDLQKVITDFSEVLSECRLLVAHNMDFDQTILGIVYARLGLPNTLLDKALFCTMNESTEVCKLPKARGTGYKWPKLTEVYAHFFGAPHDKAHDAINDVRATAKVYYALKQG